LNLKHVSIHRRQIVQAATAGGQAQLHCADATSCRGLWQMDGDQTSNGWLSPLLLSRNCCETFAKKPVRINQTIHTLNCVWVFSST